MHDSNLFLQSVFQELHIQVYHPISCKDLNRCSSQALNKSQAYEGLYIPVKELFLPDEAFDWLNHRSHF